VKVTIDGGNTKTEQSFCSETALGWQQRSANIDFAQTVIDEKAKIPHDLLMRAMRAQREKAQLLFTGDTSISIPNVDLSGKDRVRMDLSDEDEAADKATAEEERVVLCTVIAIADYTASLPDELTLKVGDLVAVWDADEPWWSGYLLANPSAAGTFPSNFVETEEETAAAKAEAAAIARTEARAAAKAKRAAEDEAMAKAQAEAEAAAVAKVKAEAKAEVSAEREAAAVAMEELMAKRELRAAAQALVFEEASRAKAERIAEREAVAKTRAEAEAAAAAKAKVEVIGAAMAKREAVAKAHKEAEKKATGFLREVQAKATADRVAAADAAAAAKAAAAEARAQEEADAIAAAKARNEEKAAAKAAKETEAAEIKAAEAAKAKAEAEERAEVEARKEAQAAAEARAEAEARAKVDAEEQLSLQRHSEREVVPNLGPEPEPEPGRMGELELPGFELSSVPQLESPVFPLSRVQLERVGRNLVRPATVEEVLACNLSAWEEMGELHEARSRPSGRRRWRWAMRQLRMQWGFLAGRGGAEVVVEERGPLGARFLSDSDDGPPRVHSIVGGGQISRHPEVQLGMTLLAVDDQVVSSYAQGMPLLKRAGRPVRLRFSAVAYGRVRPTKPERPSSRDRPASRDGHGLSNRGRRAVRAAPAPAPAPAPAERAT
jgi:hypothetical protein